MTFLLKHRRLASDVIDALLAAAALTASFLLRFEFSLDRGYLHMLAVALPVAVIVKIVVFRAFGIRDLTWRYLGFRDLLRFGAANLAATCAATVVLRVVIGNAFPRSIHILDGVLCLMLMIAARAGIRVIVEIRRVPESDGRRILIYGAGNAGVTVLRELAAHPRLGFRVAGFIDDDPAKRHLRVNGARVLGNGSEIAEIVRKREIDEVLIALSSAPGSVLAEILERCRAAGIAAKRIPGLSERMQSRILVDQLREVRLEDLLGRSPVVLDEGGLRARLAHRVVLVTGAGGSIGSELCRQIARYGPAALIGFDQAETPLYQIDQEMRERFPGVTFIPEVGSIRNRARLAELFEQHQPQSVFHAAAYKHVPMMEAHLFEAVENNVFGTHNLAQEATRWGVEDFVLISSDKAVRPVNVMGATKRLSEMVCLAGQGGSSTGFMAVRFGNVLGSNGSVIPLFRRQIAAGGPVTVTHPEMRRFFMTIPEASQLVLQAACVDGGAGNRGREIFVLDMGEPVRIVDLARNLILLSGLRPDHDIAIAFTGIRPGEKLYEELSAMEENTLPTRHAQIRIFSGRAMECDTVSDGLEQLRRAVERRDTAGVVLAMKDMVPDYNPSAFLLRRAVRAEAQDKARSVVA